MNIETITQTLREAESLAISLTNKKLEMNNSTSDFKTGTVFNSEGNCWNRTVWGDVVTIYLHLHGIDLDALVIDYNKDYALKHQPIVRPVFKAEGYMRISKICNECPKYEIGICNEEYKECGWSSKGSNLACEHNKGLNDCAVMCGYYEGEDK